MKIQEDISKMKKKKENKQVEILDMKIVKETKKVG